MKKIILTLFVLLFCWNVFAQKTQVQVANDYLDARKEVYFKFTVSNHQEIAKYSSLISIHKVKKDTVFAFANRKEFERFLSMNTPFQTLEPIKISTSTKKTLSDFDTYPTYNEYVSMLKNYETLYPDLIQTESIGSTVKNRAMYLVKISKNVKVKENEPEVLVAGSIHGNEPEGFLVLLHYIDYLLTNYGKDSKVSHLLDNVEVWINPLVNVDGFYENSSSPTRYNANGVDLNRNFPDPQMGEHPDGSATQKETQAIMNFVAKHHFVMSLGLHSGSEVVNYPWDTWSTSYPDYRSHADATWFKLISHQYADTVQKYSSNSYMSSFDDGTTNGYDWYQVTGGEQDYMNYFKHCREVTVEISNEQNSLATANPALWEYNYRSLLYYSEQALYGFYGQVTRGTNLVQAKIEVLSHDKDASEVYSDANGFYYRPIYGGTYNLRFSEGGDTVLVKSVTVSNYQRYQINVDLLSKDVSQPSDTTTTLPLAIYPNPVQGTLTVKTNSLGESKVSLLNSSGQEVFSGSGTTFYIDTEKMRKGLYVCKIKGKTQTKIEKIILK